VYGFIISLYIVNPHGYIILITNLIKAVKSGKISKVLVRGIIRLLRRRGLDVSPELVEAAK